MGRVPRTSDLGSAGRVRALPGAFTLTPDFARASAGRPEADLIRTAARVELGPAHRERILHLLRSGLDWGLIHHLAQRHRLGPLLYTHLEALGAGGAVPKPIFIELWRRYEHHSRRNSQLAASLTRAVTALAQHGVPCVPYKGPVLAQALYGSLALRVFDDIDLLVRRRDLSRARSILETEGYEPYYALAPSVETAMVASRLQYHLVLVHRASGHLLEVHWKTDPALPVERDDDAWWSARCGSTLSGGSARAFTDDEQLLVSCVHAMRHQGYRLCWIVDVAEQLRRPRPRDWPWIIERAGCIGAWRRLAVSLLLAADVLDAPVPQEVLSKASADRGAQAVAQRIARRLFLQDAGELGAAERLRLDLSLFDRVADRGRHLLSVLFEPSFHEWLAYPLPRPLYPLYLPMRVWRIGRKHAARATDSHRLDTDSRTRSSRQSSRGGQTTPAAPADGGGGRV